VSGIFPTPLKINVKMVIYDILGRVVKTLINELQNAGYKSISWDGTDEYGNQVSSGIYIYRIVANNYVDAKKMLLIR
jgi:flagellar hook assembly protein FlgD